MPIPDSTSISLSLKEINKRNENGELLVIFNNNVYNLTKFKSVHPGGAMSLEHMKGKDASDQILAFHPIHVIQKRIPGFCIGRLDEKDILINPISDNWKLLNQKLKDNGLFEPKPEFWVYQVFKFACLFASAVCLAVFGGSNLWMHLASALTLATFWHQAAFMAHDGKYLLLINNNFVNAIILFLSNSSHSYNHQNA